jgi:predicted CopG family antitoxin
MGFHKRAIPNLEKLIEIHKASKSDSDFIREIVGKAEAVSGPVESITYLDKVYEKLISENGRKS